SRFSSTASAVKNASRPIRSTGLTPHLSKAWTEMPRLAAISDLLSQPRCFVGVDLAMNKQQPRPEKSSYVVQGRASNYPQWGVPLRSTFMNSRRREPLSSGGAQCLSDGLIHGCLYEGVILGHLAHDPMEVEARRVLRLASEQQDHLHRVTPPLSNANRLLTTAQNEEGIGVAFAA